MWYNGEMKRTARGREVPPFVRSLAEANLIEKRRRTMTVEQIATICHEANASLCNTINDNSQTPWDEAPEWQRESAIKGVEFHLANPNASASASHDSWLQEKSKMGWVYGEVKDADAKTHPCIVPFEQLPPEQQAKDHLFRGIVHALAPFVA